VIDPKMAFGTGHHDTTSQMMGHILELSLKGKKVIDMGTGTGILAFLAKMRGAGMVTGIEIDHPAYENAVDNAMLNNCDVQFIHGDASALDTLPEADVFFANINRNIILNDLARYASVLKPGGTMLLSGFYEEDIPMILEAALKYQLKEKSRLVSDARWTALKLEKNF
ncbi:MAG: 50S ribosomal protein L11 methyltransferase, partial [Muribaculaceae bacterium]|nr:50S ribosomal protein L11 methyltransferase [Muribaculaceae bacterium]